jgi:hypothetical protein
MHGWTLTWLTAPVPKDSSRMKRSIVLCSRLKIEATAGPGCDVHDPKRLSLEMLAL